MGGGSPFRDARINVMAYFIMKAILRVWKDCRTSIVAYLVYLALYFNQIHTEQKFRASINHNNTGEQIAWGEGVMYGELLIFSIGAGGVFVCLLIALIYKDQRKHSLIFGFLFLVPVIYYLTALLN